MLKPTRYIAAILMLGAVLLVANCGTQSGASFTTNERGIDLRNFDTSCKPCEDFNRYANGAWLERNPIPAEYSDWNTAREIRQRNQKLLHEILEESSRKTDAEKGSTVQKVGDFYYSAMDTACIEAERSDPLQKDLERIAALSDLEDLQKFVGDYHVKNQRFLFDIGSEQDFTDNTNIIAYATQGGLGLPDRDYYTREDDESQKLRNQYVEHVANMFILLGDEETAARAQAETIMGIETRLAKASLTKVEMRDLSTYYNILSLRQADKQTPNFSWSKYFTAIGLPQVKSFSYAHPKFFAEMNKLLGEVSVDGWKSYLRWHLINSFAPYLSSDFVEENFRFFDTILRGTPELKPRWKRALSAVNGNLGMALGQLYVERAFPPESKARALEMINNLQAALEERLENLEWMSDETRDKALQKLARFGHKIGYPDKWRDYSALEIERNSYVDNVRRGQAFEMRRQLDEIGKPVDRTEWSMTPQTVNAYYHPLLNEIVFLAGILQPPMFDGQIDDAVNYGCMGAIIGHEMLHAFDDRGSQFDADGNLQNWWTETDRRKFEERTKRLVEQFNNYVAVDDLHVNGELTLGENIADLGGLTISYAALEKALEGKPQTKIDGFTPQQRFFLSFAQAWRGNVRPEKQKLLINTDSHSPGRFRCIGPLSNLESFRKAFGCKEGDPMVRPPDERVVIF